MKTYGGVEVSGELHAPAAIPPGKEPRYQLDRRPDVAEKKNLVLLGIEPGPSSL
jgi:hypothetical protein